MKFIFLFISCLQLLAVSQYSLAADTDIGEKGLYEYTSYVTVIITLLNGTVIRQGGVLLSPRVVATLPDDFIDAEEIEIWSGQATCSSYEQVRLVDRIETTEFLGLAVTTEAFEITPYTQPTEVTTEDVSPTVVKAVGCAPPVETINTANFYYYPLETCKNAYNDFNINENIDCRKCPFPASTCTAPRGNPTYDGNKAYAISYKVHPTECTSGGYVQFVKLYPQLSWIHDVIESAN